MKQIYFAILLFCVSVCASAESNSYPLTELERPITLPKGIGEVGLGLVYGMQSQNNGWPPLALSLKYGISDDLELDLLGLRYRFFRNDWLQTSVRAGLRGIGQSSGGSWVIMEGGFDVKHIYSPRVAMLYTFDGRYHQYSAQTDIVDLSVSIGPLAQLTESSALAINYCYRKISETGSAQGNWARAAFLWSMRTDLDFKFEGAIGNVRVSNDFRYSGNRNMYENTVGTQVRWRF